MSKGAPDLTACDKEPIHLSGAIQPFGCLLAINLRNCTVEFASKNVSEFLKIDLEKVLGAGEDYINRQIDDVSIGHTHNFQSGDYRVIEFEKNVPERPDAAARLLAEIQSITEAVSTAELFQRMADATQRLSGFERVMIYKFGFDWTGTVIAETITGQMVSFLDLRFPASDIPAHARRLYSENLLRYIPDVNAAPVAIESALCPVPGFVPVYKQGASSTLDLSQSELRSVSPVHIEYLKNMEVGASLSLSIRVDGKLWGLVACHNTKALSVSPERREHCKILCQLFARLLAMQEQTSIEKRRADAKITQMALLDKLSQTDDLVDGLSSNSTLLLDLLHANGAALKVGADFYKFGDAPASNEALAMVNGLQLDENCIFASNNLKCADVQTRFKGVVAAKLSSQDDTWLLWVRPEVVSEVSWAGEPVKMPAADDPQQLHPRHSFAVWKETVSGFSHPWTEEELSAATALCQYLRLKIERDRAEQERNRLAVAVNDSNQKLVQFVDTISHDLRSPLISIGNLAQWIEKDLGESLIGIPKDNLNLLQKRVSKMRAQLNELLDYSKAGNFRAQPSVVDVSEIVRSIAETLKTTHKVQWQIDEMPTFSTVKAPLEHVFSNLIDNAVKHSQRPEGKIEIGYEDAGSFYRFFVADQGKGIPVEYLEEIFLPLRTLSSADSDSHGMGLAFVKRIVEQAGGEVAVTSAPGVGSRFNFTWKKIWDGNKQNGKPGS